MVVVEVGKSHGIPAVRATEGIVAEGERYIIAPLCKTEDDAVLGTMDGASEG